MLKSVGSGALERFQTEARKLLEKTHREKLGPENAEAKPGRSTDRVSLGNKAAEGVGYEPAVKEVDIGAAYRLLRDLVARNLQEQGIATRVATGGGEVDLESLSSEEAQSLIAEDGYFGVEQTSERIFQFAVGIAGNDPSRIDAIRKGIADGYRQAEEAWGGELPEISYRTRDAVEEKLDNWLAGFREAR
ncbi:hypothetical protein [Trichloromonas sp.]|uniref:hypothetical protein n=1 Tax=Trichloromonas sp. TaxID=3069249 RepID=UPI002A453A8B|nr:hypothetical protein [Trichloromonas sp.]